MIDALFLSKARVAILQILLLEPDSQFYLRELANKTGIPLRSVQLEVKRLTAAGILLCKVNGRQTYYSINEQCTIVPELRSMFIKTVGVADVIRNALMPEAAYITAAFIYGSFAQGDIRPESDVDLFVIGNVTLRQLTVLLKSLNIGRIINPIVMSKTEFQERLAQGDHFINTLMHAPKIFLIGDEDGLARLN